MKTKERELARALRRDEGRSLRDIAELLGVAKSSVSLWVRDIELTPAQHEALRARNVIYDRQRLAHKIWSGQCRERRLIWQAEGRELAHAGDSSFAAGCMLYWAEGGKSRNVVKLTNSDPEVLRFFAEFLRRHFEVPDEQMAVTCNLFADHLVRQRELEQFWLDTLRLPLSCLRKSTVNVYSKYSQKKRQNKLPYGTCRVSVYRTRIVQTIYGAIQEYGGFDRPEWLD
jgi:transcriptional regulator with XRE-family HTH domain